MMVLSFFKTDAAELIWWLHHKKASDCRYQFTHQSQILPVSLSFATPVNSEMSLVNYISQHNFTIRNAGKVNNV